MRKLDGAVGSRLAPPVSGISGKPRGGDHGRSGPGTMGPAPPFAEPGSAGPFRSATRKPLRNFVSAACLPGSWASHTPSSPSDAHVAVPQPLGDSRSPRAEASTLWGPRPCCGSGYRSPRRDPRWAPAPTPHLFTFPGKVLATEMLTTGDDFVGRGPTRQVCA